MKNNKLKLPTASIIVMLMMVSGIAAASITTDTPTPISTPVVNMDDTIKTLTDYFNGNITKQEAMDRVSIVIPPEPVPTATPSVYVPMPVPSPRIIEDTTKLEISPQYGNFRLQLGENKNITVRVRNKDNKTIVIKPMLVTQPYSTYIIEKEWINITPETVEMPSGESQIFSINISVPKNVPTGYYNGQIAFTDEVIQYPTPITYRPYPEPYPNYIHYFSLSIDVWTLPIIQIMPQYISDQLEAGKEYDYEIQLKNIGDETVAINPIIGEDASYYGPYGTPPALTSDMITIIAPQNIPANTTETLKIHISVPADSKGYYNGWIDLGIDDPSIREREGRINFNFDIWKQPTEPFTKNFSLIEDASVTIEITGSNYFSYPYPMGPGQIQEKIVTKKPSFGISLEGNTGSVELNSTKRISKGGVSISKSMDNKGIYQENDMQYIETYKVYISAGEWRLKILPTNTQNFQYSITIE